MKNNMTSEKLPSNVLKMEDYSRKREQVQERRARARADAGGPGEAAVPALQDVPEATLVQFEPAPEAEPQGRAMTYREHLDQQMRNLSEAIAKEVRRHEDTLAALEAARHNVKMQLMDDDIKRMQGGARDAA